jgi:PrgI family protein
MQFTVPQFIEMEDKIFGPFTFKQFLYMLGGAGGSYMCYALIPSPYSYPFVLAMLALAGALAFYKYNDRPFILLLESGFYYLVRSKLYLWKHVAPAVSEVETSARNTLPQTQLPTLSDSKLKSLSWNLDINEYVDKANMSYGKVR